MAELPSPLASAIPVLLGIPFDANSSYLPGAAAAPPAIRAAFHSSAGNPWTESGVNLSNNAFEDAGDLRFTSDAFASIEEAVGAVLDRGSRPVCLGGDHSITLPVVRAIGKKSPSADDHPL